MSGVDRAAAVESAGQALAECRATAAQMTPREQAEAAYDPAGDLSVDELEERIRRRRGLPPKARSA